MRAIDISGQRFGKLVAVRVVKTGKKRVWECKCDCGGTGYFPTFGLRSGSYTTCGCSRRYDLTRQRFGKLVVVELSKKEKQRRRSWVCKCDCGEKTVVSTSRLRSGRTCSCGCGVIEAAHMPKGRRTRKGETNRKAVLATYKGNATRKGLPFEISDEHAFDLMGSRCHYCGGEPGRVRNVRGSNGSFVYNGIDRKDNTKGYVDGNVVSCCTECNMKKKSDAYDDFLEWVKRVHDYRGLGTASAEAPGR